MQPSRKKKPRRKQTCAAPLQDAAAAGQKRSAIEYEADIARLSSALAESERQVRDLHTELRALASGQGSAARKRRIELLRKERVLLDRLAQTLLYSRKREDDGAITCLELAQENEVLRERERELLDELRRYEEAVAARTEPETNLAPQDAGTSWWRSAKQIKDALRQRRGGEGAR